MAGEKAMAVYERRESRDRSGEEPPFCTLPHEVVFAIFEYVPTIEIVQTCRRVCRGWKLFFDDPRFWQRRMAQSGNYDGRLANIPNVNWPQLCIRTIYNPNLIKSIGMDGELSLDPWTISYDDWKHFSQNLMYTEQQEHRSGYNYGGGNKWDIEKTIPDQNMQLLAENGVSSKNYVTSYEWCCRQQILDLSKLGFAPAILDTLQPVIEVSEWFCVCSDHGSKFKLRVDLLDKQYSSLAKFEHSEETPQRNVNALGWRKVEHVFRNYRAGVQYIRFADAGKGSQQCQCQWVGHYGSKMAGAWVRVWFSGK